MHPLHEGEGGAEAGDRGDGAEALTGGGGLEHPPRARGGATGEDAGRSAQGARVGGAHLDAAADTGEGDGAQALITLKGERAGLAGRARRGAEGGKAAREAGGRSTLWSPRTHMAARPC